jgi:hypothetical protein
LELYGAFQPVAGAEKAVLGSSYAAVRKNQKAMLNVSKI